MSVITQYDDISSYMSCVILSSMRLECLGMSHSKGSVTAGIKKKYGWKGDKLSILQQYFQKHRELYPNDNGPVVTNTIKFLAKQGIDVL